MIIIAEQVQDAVNHQPLQLCAQAHAVALGIILRDRDADGNSGEALAGRRGAEIERDHIGGGRILQKITVQNANRFFIDKIDFEMNCRGRVREPKLI